MPSFLKVLEQLFNSSCKTLRNLRMFAENFPLSHISSPPLINVRELNIFMPESGQLIVNTLPSIDYPSMLPALSEVFVEAKCKLSGDMLVEAEEDHPWLSNSVERGSVELGPSLTVKQLTLMVNWAQLELDNFSDIFPNVRKFETSNQEYSFMSIPYES